jgi:hypothetical protein
MKINEIVTEGKRKGKINKQAKRASTGEWLFRDEGVDRAYNLNRVMMAAGMADGTSSKAVDMDEASWVEKHNVARPYTEAEHMMMQSAFNTVSSKSKHSIPHHRSVELDDVHKVSPVGRTGPIKRKS